MIRFLPAKISTIVSLLIILFTFSNCQNSNEESQVQDIIHLSISPDQLPETSKLSELAKEIRLIPLEYSAECKIGGAQNIVIGSNNILVSTNSPVPGLFRFDKNGKFKNTIGRLGKGPGEFSEIWNIELDEKANEVLIASRFGTGMIKYNLEGEFLENIILPEIMRTVKYLGDNTYVGRTWEDHGLAIFNTDQSDTSFYIPTPRDQQSQLVEFGGNHFSKVFFTSMGKDTIWEVQPDTVRPYIVYDFGNGHFSFEEYIATIMKHPKGRLAILPDGAFYGAGYIHFKLLRDDTRGNYRIFHVVVDIQTKQSWHLIQSPESDDILFCSSTDICATTNSGEWVSIVDVYDLKEALPLIKKNKNFNYPDNIISQIEAMSNNDNPVIVILKFK